MKKILIAIAFLLTFQLAPSAGRYEPALIIPRSTIKLRIEQWSNYAGIFRYDALAYAYVNGKISAYQELLAEIPPDMTDIELRDAEAP